MEPTVSLLPLASGGSFLVPEAQVLLYTVIVFLAMLAILWKFAWGPLMRALEEREERITRRIAEAEAKFQQAEAERRRYEDLIAKAKEEAAEIIAEGKRDVEKVVAEKLSEGQEEAAQMLERTRREIALAKEAAIQELRVQMVQLTADLAARVIQREVRPEDHRRFVEDALQQVQQAARSERSATR